MKMGTCKRRLGMVLSLDSLRSVEPSSILPLVFSPLARKKAREKKYVPKTDPISLSKSGISLKFLKLAPISSFDENSLSSKNPESTRRKFKFQGIMPINVPKNIVSRCAFQSQKGWQNDMPKLQNQDSILFMPKINKKSHQFLLGVFDGHGENGHLVSCKIKETLEIQSLLCPSTCTENDLEDYLEQSINLTCQKILASSIETDYSGSTLCTVLLSGNFLVCGNIGDSRCVLGRFDDEWTSIDLSVDHKPSVASEAERIRKFGGIVKAENDSDDDNPVIRAWVPGENTFGIAMSRSVGDKLAKKVGVSHQCDIRSRRLNYYDKFIIIATDGIWDVLSSQEAVNMVSTSYRLNKSEIACNSLINEAKKRWKAISTDVDDISVIVLYFQTKGKSS